MNRRSKESGNILFFILIGIVLIALVTVALRDSGGLNSSIDKESIAAQAQELIKKGAELNRAVQFILDNGTSESDLRFAHPDANVGYGSITSTPQNQAYSSQGGKAIYMVIPMSYKTGPFASAGAWEVGGDRAISGAGSDKADLYANAYPLTNEICLAINRQLGYTNTTLPASACNGDANGRFTGTFTTSSPRIIDQSAFSPQPALQFCIYCNDNGVNAYFVPLIAR